MWVRASRILRQRSVWDATPAGVHAQVLSPTGAYYVDPIPNAADAYASYRRSDVVSEQLQTRLDEITDAGGKHKHDDHKQEPQLAARGEDRSGNSSAGPAIARSGTELRVYRTAIAAVGEYTQFHGGTVSEGLAAIVTAINRLNGVFETELSVRLELVANNDQIVYTNGATDPYSNGSASLLIVENQVNLDLVIGSQNYDLGHVFATSGAGVAALGSLGVDGFKARGTSGVFPPTGDSYWIDFVAHEMGHQFGAGPFLERQHRIVFTWRLGPRFGLRTREWLDNPQLCRHLWKR